MPDRPLRKRITPAPIILFTGFLLLVGIFVNAQELQSKGTDSISGNGSSVSRSRTWLVSGGHVALWGASFVALNKAWYADYPKSSFHFFNDNGEWNQMDKAGHAWTAYQMTTASAASWKWAGMPEKKAAWLGAVSGMAYQSIIEIQDGFSDEWGFSWGDMLANAGGAALYLGQQLGWKEQRIHIKMSYWPYDYPDELLYRRNDLFGSSTAERLLKDYNSQTYWASANLSAFFPRSKIPGWLNMAVGYGSDGMLGGYGNSWVENGNPVTRNDIPRVRRLFLSPDIDLTRIHSRSKLVRTLLVLANMIKIPAPAIEWNSTGRFRLHAFYF